MLTNLSLPFFEQGRASLDSGKTVNEAKLTADNLFLFAVANCSQQQQEERGEWSRIVMPTAVTGQQTRDRRRSRQVF
jgi:hypothetical protein